MKRQRSRPTGTLEERLTDVVRRLREQARSLPAGAEREEVMRKARQAETGLHMSELLRSPSLQAPK